MVQPPNSFTLFPKLPRELQDQVWTQACTLPRVLVVRDSQPQKSFHPASLVPPAILHTTPQSRYIALQYYRYTDFGIAGSAYFNGAVDVLYMRDRITGWSDMPLNTRLSVRSIAVNLRVYISPSGIFKSELIPPTLEAFPNIDHVTAIVGSKREHARFNITGFRLADYQDFGLKENIGYRGLSNWIRLRKAEMAAAEKGERVNMEVERLPKIVFGVLERGRDWPARNKTVESVLGAERALKRNAK